MPRLPRVPLGAAAPSPAASPGPPPGPPPSPHAYRQTNPYEPPPAEYKPASMLAEHKWLAILCIVAVVAFAFYCWKMPHRSSALDARTPPAAHAATASGAAARGAESNTAPAAGPQTPIYIEAVPDKEH